MSYFNRLKEIVHYEFVLRLDAQLFHLQRQSHFGVSVEIEKIRLFKIQCLLNYSVLATVEITLPIMESLNAMKLIGVFSRGSMIGTVDRFCVDCGGLVLGQALNKPSKCIKGNDNIQVLYEMCNTISYELICP